MFYYKIERTTLNNKDSYDYYIKSLYQQIIKLFTNFSNYIQMCKRISMYIIRKELAAYVYYI